MYSSKEELLRRAERHEESAKSLRALASGKYINDKGKEFAYIAKGKLHFNDKTPTLDIAEFKRFAQWVNKVFVAFGGNDSNKSIHAGGSAIAVKDRKEVDYQEF